MDKPSVRAFAPSPDGIAATIAHNESDDAPASVFETELRDITMRRARNGRPAPKLLDEAPGLPTATAGLTGIGLSGGGVRSSAFCLGTLQALHTSEMSLGLVSDSFDQHRAEKSPSGSSRSPSDLQFVDYLSSVSGGGYTGACLSLGMSRVTGRFPFGLTSQEAEETSVMRHIRDNSRYLISKGFKDVLSGLMVYLRGLAANWVIVATFLFGFSALLLAVIPTHKALEGLLDSDFWKWLISAFVAFCLILAILVSLIKGKTVSARNQFTDIVVKITKLFLVMFILTVAVFSLSWYKVLTLGVVVQTAQGTTATGQIKSGFDAIAYLYPSLAAVLLMVLPFVRRLAESAVESAVATKKDLLMRLASHAILLVTAAILPLLLFLLTVQLITWGLLEQASAPMAPKALLFLFEKTKNCSMNFDLKWGSEHQAALTYAWLSILLLCLWLVIDINANSLHQAYRDRLSNAFLFSNRQERTEQDATVEDRFPLSQIDTLAAPYHLINTALNIPGSDYANRRGRNAEFFLFSRHFLGSALTGYLETEWAEKTKYRVDLGTAMAISGAAVAPNMGMASLAPLSLTLALMNVRLGRWVRNPRLEPERPPQGGLSALKWEKAPGPRFLLKEAFSKSGQALDQFAGDHLAKTQDRYLFLTDGGHIENLGVYELLRRRCQLIISIDAEADPDLRSPAIAQLERFARTDFGVTLEIDTRPIAARHRTASPAIAANTPSDGNDHGPHVAIGCIHYPPAMAGLPGETGVLLYVKPSLSGDENSYVRAYRQRSSEFPQETTADQFFSEEQFECYRALGEHAMRRALEGLDPVIAPNWLPPEKSEELLAIANRLLGGTQLRLMPSPS